MTRKTKASSKRLFWTFSGISLVIALLISAVTLRTPQASQDPTLPLNVTTIVKGAIYYADALAPNKNQQSLRIYQLNNNTPAPIAGEGKFEFDAADDQLPAKEGYNANRTFRRNFTAKRGNVYRVVFRDDRQPETQCSYVDFAIPLSFPSDRPNVRAIFDIRSTATAGGYTMEGGDITFPLQAIVVPCPATAPAPVPVPTDAPPQYNVTLNYTGKLLKATNNTAPFQLKEHQQTNVFGNIRVKAARASVTRDLNNILATGTEPEATLTGKWVKSSIGTIFNAEAATAGDTPAPSPTPTTSVTPTAGTTPTPSPSATPEPPTAAACTADLDIAYVVDNSGTMNDTNAHALMKRAVQDMKPRWRPAQDKVALVKFSNPTRVVDRFTSDFDTVSQHARNLQFEGGGSNGTSAVQVTSKLFNDSRRGKDDVAGVVIILTDSGSTFNQTAFNTALKDFQDNNIRYFGLSLSGNNNQLKTLTQKGGGTYTRVTQAGKIDEAINAVMASVEQTSGNCVGVRLTSSVNTLRLNQEATLTYTYRNNSRQSIFNAVVTQTLPEGLVVAENGAREFTLPVGTITGGATGTVTIKVKPEER